MDGKNDRSLIVLSSPSGGGKSTVAKFLMNRYSNLKFSVSATTRPMRPTEQEGVHYFFLEKNDFLEKVKSGDFVENEEIYGNCYGTLKSEVEKAIKSDSCLLFDVDFKGALSLKKAFPDDTLTIFLAPPSAEELEKRLKGRNTESDDQIEKRMARVEMEMGYQDKFDYKVVNNKLEETFANSARIIDKHIKKTD